MPSQYTQKKDQPARFPARKRSPYTQVGTRIEDGFKYRDGATFSFAIMAHEKRSHWVPDIERSLPEPEVVWDKYNDRHETGLRSILAYNSSADYHVVVQDDVILCRDFVEGLSRAICYVPEGHPLGLYHGRTGKQNNVGYNRAIKDRASWLAAGGPVWGPAIVYPTASIPDLAEFYRSIPHIPNYDRRVTRYYSSVGKQCFYPVPSLVEHRTEDNPSLASPDRTASRRALRYVGPQSALSVDWSGPVVWADI